MLECEGDALFIYGFGNKISVGFDLVTGVAHGDADAGIFDHGDVVFTVAESNGIGGIDIQMAADGFDALVLTAADGKYIGKIGAPAHSHELFRMGEEPVLGTRQTVAVNLVDGEAEGLLRPIPRNRDGFLEIGVFHGDAVYASVYHPISRELLETCGLDYLALGHIHGMQLPRQYGRTWCGWPGAAMGRGFDETGEKGLFLVALDRGICETKFLPLSMPRYEILRCPAGHIQIPPHCEQSICRLILTGESEPVDVEQLHGELADRFLSLEIRDETTPPLDLWASCGDGTLRGLTMENLKARYDRAATEEERQMAILAARYALAALEGRELP